MTDLRLREAERQALATMLPEDLVRVRDLTTQSLGAAAWDEWCREHLGRAQGDLVHLRLGDRHGFQRARGHLLNPLARLSRLRGGDLVDQTLCNKVLGSETSPVVSRWWEPWGALKNRCAMCVREIRAQAAARAGGRTVGNLRLVRAVLSSSQCYRMGVVPIRCLLGEHDWSEWSDTGHVDARWCVHGACPAREEAVVTPQTRLFK